MDSSGDQASEYADPAFFLAAASARHLPRNRPEIVDAFVQKRRLVGRQAMAGQRGHYRCHWFSIPPFARDALVDFTTRLIDVIQYFLSK